MAELQQIPRRSEVAPGDCWDLSSLFPNDEAWETAYAGWEKKIGRYARFQGKLKESAKSLAACLKFDLDFERESERLGTYAFLKTAEDSTNGACQAMQARYMNAASRAGQASSFLRPEILAIPRARMQEFLKERVLAPYRLLLERVLRYRPHTLGTKEERLLAMQTEMAQASNEAFHQLHDADMKFGLIKDEQGQRIELSHSTYSRLLHSPKRELRRGAFHQYYEQYRGHQYTFAATLQASIQRDLYYARARNYPSALEAALFPDRIPLEVYDNLIASVRRNLPALHRYYALRRRAMRLRDIHQYDTYVPILAELQTDYPWDKAVDLVVDALTPLGSEYGSALAAGLRGRWCDRYENQGKRSGAFSAGSYDGDPYILMNYQPQVLDHVFTLAHEAGHSMHSYFSARHQPFAYYNYVIFVAEVASTFNEQLLAHRLLQQAGDDRQRAYLLNRQIDAVRTTIYRQTMFAEFEKTTHALAEKNEPLTLDRLKQVYHDLLVDYFGPEFALDPELDLECLRIPHFYRAFYVYKYATGMSAAIALANRVLAGGDRQRDDYLGFLTGGCSKDPLDLLADAGVDMRRPEPVDRALATFASQIEELDRLL